MSDVIDLKTFVAQTLIQIVEGVQEAAREVGGGNNYINPDEWDGHSSKSPAKSIPSSR